MTLGAFLGTFSYALMVLRTVRTQTEGEFVPHLSMSVGILLAFVCVGTLVYFVGHMATRINVDTVIGLVSEDVRKAIERLTTDESQTKPPALEFWRDAEILCDDRRGYLQQFDDHGLAKWAAEHDTAIRLLVRPGKYVFPGAPIALIAPPVEGAAKAIRYATAVGSQQVSDSDIEFAVRQLVEVAVRALSPGINDPYTAMAVIDRLGAALCDVVPLRFPNGVFYDENRPVLVVPAVDYDGLLDSMLHMIRQNGANNPAVLIRMLDMLTSVASCEHDAKRILSLERHANMILGDAIRSIHGPSDLNDIRMRHRQFDVMRKYGPIGHVEAKESSQT
jgi:uncharacterized membrane protein